MFASKELDNKKSNTRREPCQTIALNASSQCSKLRTSSDSAALTATVGMKGDDVPPRVGRTTTECRHTHREVLFGSPASQ